MSRLIVTGLSNMDHPNTSTTESRPNANPTPKPRPHSLYTPLSSSSHIRSSNLSTSSTCTTATSATRFSTASPTSVSTFFEEQEPTSPDAEQKLKTSSDELATMNGSPDSLGSQELIVRDTGATPTVSPNPKFKFRIERRRERENQRGRKDVWDQLETPGISIQDRLGKDEQREGTLRTLTANSSAIDIDAAGSSTRCHRRKSRETSAASLRSLRPTIDEEETRFSPSAPPESASGDLMPLSAPNSNSNHESQTQALPWTKRWT